MHTLRGLSAPTRRPQIGALQLRLQACVAYGYSLDDFISYDLKARKYASQSAKLSATAATSSPQNSRGKAAKHESLIHRLNPPTSTLPAPLDFPKRTPDQSTAGYWWKVGKGFWAFYKQGVKNIYANRKASKEIRARIEDAPNIQASAQPGTAAREILKDASRSDWHLVRRSGSEMRRVPVFALILAVFGEWTPLLVMFATPIVPYNCRIPRQVRRSREKQEERRRRSFRGAFRDLDGSDRSKLYVPTPAHVDHVLAAGKTADGRSTNALSHICRTLNIYPGWQDALRAVRPAATVLEASTRRSLRKHLTNYLRRDDEYLLRSRSKDLSTTIPSLLSDEEALIAAEERGIDILNRPLSDVRRDLNSWLESVGKDSLHKVSDDQYIRTVARLCLTRPNQWGKDFEKLR